ncbi:MAG: hypothetical protein IV094_04550 [Vitreoscilla sp.]|nr:hypothetical protein [Vitreoscilla sp.]
MFYLFHHIPKTAGTSVLAGLSGLFRVVRDYHRSTSEEDLGLFDVQRIDIAALGERDILCGHWNLRGRHLYHRYPELDSHKPRKITFIRDPLSTAQSGVRYGIQQGWCKPGTQNEALISRAGYISAILDCNELTYKSVLDGYWFVGDSGRLNEGFELLTSLVQKQAIHVPRVNTTDEIGITFSNEAIELFIERSRVDYMIYEYAKTLYTRRLQAHIALAGR